MAGLGLGDILGIVGGIVGSVVAPEFAIPAAIGMGVGGGLGQLVGSGDVGRAAMTGLMGYGMGSAADMLGAVGAGAGTAGIEPVSPGYASSALDPSKMIPTSVIDNMAGNGGQAAAQAASGSGPLSFLPDKAASYWGNVGKGFSTPGAFDQFGSISGLQKTALPFGLGAYGLGQQSNTATQTVPQQQMYGSPPMGGGRYAQQRQLNMPPPGWDYSTGREWSYYKDGGPVPPPKKQMPAPTKNFPWPLNEGYWSSTPQTPQQDQFGRPLPREQQYAGGGRVSHPMFDKMLPREVSAIAKGLSGYRHLQGEAQSYLDGQSDSYHGVIKTLPYEESKQLNMDRFERNPDTQAELYEGYARGGPVSGPGGGMSDAIPAIVDGRRPAALSSGEFVVPAAAVAGLGQGSTEAGTGVMNQIVDHGLGQMQAQAGKQRMKNRMKGGGLGAMRPFPGAGMPMGVR